MSDLMDTVNKPVQEPNDERLLSLAIDGNERAFTELVERHQKPLYDFVWRQLESHADTADICQKAFIQVFLKARDYRGEAKFRTWLFQIAINLCKNLYRSRDRQRIDDVEIEQAEECQAINQIEVTQNQRMLREAISRLPEKQRITMELKLFRDFTFAEIAETQQCSVGGAKANYHHALEAIKKALSESFYDNL